MTFVVFHDYPGLEYGLPKFHDFTVLHFENIMIAKSLPPFRSVSCPLIY